MSIAIAPAALAADMTLTSADPFRLIVNGGGAQRIEVSGTDFENEGHPDRNQYMHWQIRRDDGSWQRCGAVAGCRTTGWSYNREVFEIGGEFVRRAGFIELRVFRGLGMPDITDPSQAANLFSGWSNVLRIPVVNPTAPPVIKSLSKKEFPVAGSGKPGDYGFVIDAFGIEGRGQVVVIFRGDTTVWPERIDAGHLIHVTVPAKYQVASPGEISLIVRTDTGGDSTNAYIKFIQPPPSTLDRRAIARPGIDSSGRGGFAPRIASPNAVPGPGSRPTAVQVTPAPGHVIGPDMPRGPDPRAIIVQGGTPPQVRTPATASMGAVLRSGAPVNQKTGSTPPIAGTVTAPRAIALAAPAAPASAMTGALDYFLPNGQKIKGEVRGNRFFIIADGKATPAADGAYRRGDGQSIIIQGGLIVQNNGSAPSPTRPLPTVNPGPPGMSTRPMGR